MHPAGPTLGLSHHLDDDVGGDVAEQADRDREFAHGLDRAERGANLALLDLEAELVHSFSDVGVGHGTEQTAVNAGLARDFHGRAVKLFSHGLSSGDAFGLSLFEFGTAGFEFSDGSLRSALGMTLGDQEVAAVAVLDPDIIDISKAEYYINIKIHSLELRLWILLI